MRVGGGGLGEGGEEVLGGLAEDDGGGERADGREGGLAAREEAQGVQAGPRGGPVALGPDHGGGQRAEEHEHAEGPGEVQGLDEDVLGEEGADGRRAEGQGVG